MQCKMVLKGALEDEGNVFYFWCVPRARSILSKHVADCYDTFVCDVLSEGLLPLMSKLVLEDFRDHHNVVSIASLKGDTVEEHYFS